MKKFGWSVLGLGVVVALVAGVVFLVRAPNQTNEAQATLMGLETKEDTSRFARANAVREFKFPEDHGPHNDFQTEWWYYTGNLQDAQGNHFGYQFTLFRRAMAPGAIDSALSDFSTNQIYFAHFAVTDSAGNEHVAFEKYSRGAAGLAGAVAQPFHVFIEDWSARTTMGTGAAEGVQVKAAEGDFAIELNLQATKPIVLQGDRGLSQKSPERGNASYYYSMPRMTTQGKVTTPRGTFEVMGESWLDREWSTSSLGDALQGWDWFSIQLNDGREIMYYQLRQKDGKLGELSGGTLIAKDGSTRRIAKEDFLIEVLGTWQSQDSKATYPSGWRLTLPKDNLVLELQPRVKDQEMHLSTKYWEGAVTVQSANGASAGVGYVELTGYTEDFKGKL